MGSGPLPGSLARLAVEGVNATPGIAGHQRLATQDPAPGDSVVANRRKPALAKNAHWAAAI